MKAIQYNRFGGPEVLEYVDLPVPSPGTGRFLSRRRLSESISRTSASAWASITRRKHALAASHCRRSAESRWSARSWTLDPA